MAIDQLVNRSLNRPINPSIAVDDSSDDVSAGKVRVYDPLHNVVCYPYGERGGVHKIKAKSD